MEPDKCTKAFEVWIGSN